MSDAVEKALDVHFSSGAGAGGGEDFGRADTLRYNVLTFVVEEKYDSAIKELEHFINAPSEYPNFRDRLGRYVSHAIDLINAIRAKRSFPGMKSLTAAKQQELTERFKNHFDELTGTLKKIEEVQKDLRIEDVRSTAWVLKALVNSIFGIMAIALFLEVTNGLAQTAFLVLDDVFTQLVNWFFDKIGM